MADDKKVQFNNVKSDAADTLDNYLADHGFRRSVEDEGLIEGNGYKIGFTLDRSAETLDLSYDRLPDATTAAHVSEVVQSMVDRTNDGTLAGDEAGVYNYMRIYLKNRSNFPIRATGANTIERGTIDVLAEMVDSGNQPVMDPIYGVDAFVQVFECPSSGGSGMGVEGMAQLEIGNDIALLNIDYRLRGSDWWTFEPLLAGNNPGSFKVTAADYWKPLHGSPNPDPAPAPTFHTDGYTYGTALLTVHAS